ncbi:MAG TPA: XRE family transcriptional regulator [Candidatus Gemmiger stercoripullorum]|nr:XRE family transcriptional regulator [Candidatus Gemmiger stercoripullorum]
MFAERLKEARRAKKYSQAELSHRLGVTQQAVGKWETGRSTPDPQTVAQLAEILDTTADALLGLRENSVPGAVGRNAFASFGEYLIPVVGTVRAGYGALAFEEDYGKEYASVKDPQNYFYLVVKGDSMEPRISDGDLALVRRQTTLDNGDLGVMVYGLDGEGTLKKYIQRGNAVVLHPFNPAYEDLVIKGEELDHLYIAGKVVETKAKW